MGACVQVVRLLTASVHLQTQVVCSPPSPSLSLSSSSLHVYSCPPSTSSNSIFINVLDVLKPDSHVRDRLRSGVGNHLRLQW